MIKGIFASTVVFVTGLALPAAAVNWKMVASTETGALYIDRDSIRNTGLGYLSMRLTTEEYVAKNRAINLDLDCAKSAMRMGNKDWEYDNPVADVICNRIKK